MPYEPIPEDELYESERVLMPAGRNVETTTRLLSRLPDVGAYGFLLTPDPDHPFAGVVRDKWSQLDHRSGGRFALVAFEPPAQWAAAIIDRWRATLGADFDATWADWQQSYGLEPGVAYDYVDYFRADPPLRAADLPCIVIFCDAQQRRAIIRPIPDWPAEELFAFLCGVIDTVVEHLDVPADRRLDDLATALTSPDARFRSTLGHVAGRALDYLKRNPAKVVTTVLSAVLALGTANVLPLSAAVIAALTAVKGDANKSK